MLAWYHNCERKPTFEEMGVFRRVMAIEHSGAKQLFHLTMSLDDLEGRIAALEARVYSQLHNGNVWCCVERMHACRVVLYGVSFTLFTVLPLVRLL